MAHQNIVLVLLKKTVQARLLTNEVLKISVKIWHYNFILSYITTLQLIHYIYLIFSHAHKRKYISENILLQIMISET